jgi:hypothetical protein
MAETATTICNIGLGRIGATLSDDITGTDVEDVACNNVYADLRDDMLRGHPWNFAIKRALLVVNGTTPVYEYDYAYDFPSDWLRTISVSDNDGGEGYIDYRMEQINYSSVVTQAVITSVTPSVYMKYVSQVTDADLMTPDFRKALGYAVGRDVALKLTGSNTIHDMMEKLAKQALMKARSNDSLGDLPDRRPRGSWAGSRRGYRPRITE